MGWTPPLTHVRFAVDPLANLTIFLLPALILGIYLAASTMRMTRTMMLEVLRQDYVRTAWAKGTQRHSATPPGPGYRGLLARMTAEAYSATMVSVRKFDTEGPVVAADHYHIPPLERIDLDVVLGLVRDKKYFVLHAPRQTGKTSALLALRDSAERWRAGRLPLRVRQRRGGPGDAGERS